MDSKEKIKEFQQQLEKEIHAKKDKAKQSSRKTIKTNGLSLPVKLLISGGVGVVLVGLVDLFWFRQKRKRKNT